MIMNKFVLTNFRSIKFMEFDFKPGITGIIGPNAIGKSNLQMGGLFAFTGETPDTIKKSELLRDGATAGHTDAYFTISGIQYHLRRNLHNSAVRLAWTENGEVHEVTGSADVKETMENLLGMPMKMVREICFVPQFDLHTVLEQTHSNRMNYLLTLVGVEKTEKIRGMLQEGINKLPAYPDRTQHIFEFNEELVRSNQQLAALASELAPWERTLAELRSMEPEARRLQVLPDQASHDAAVQRTVMAVQNAETALGQAEATLGGVQPIPLPKELTEAEKQFLATYPVLQTQQNALQNATQQLEHLGEPPVPPQRTEEIPELRKAISELDVDIARRRERLALVKAGKCPTCGQDYTAGESPEAFEQRLLELETDRRNNAETLSVIEQAKMRYEQESATHTSRSQERLAAVTRIQAEIDRLRMLCPESMDIVDLKERSRLISEYDAWRMKMRQHESALESARQAVSNARAANIAAHAADFATADQKTGAQGILSDIQRFVDKIADQRTRMAVLESRMQSVTTMRDQYVREDELRLRSERTRVLFQEARDVLHREKLPKLALNEIRQRLNSNMASVLSMVNLGFSAYLNRDFDFMCSFPGQTEDKSVSRLSGGQKVALAVAFHLAKARTLPTMPMLILDEPTPYLNSESVKNIRRVLEKVRDFAEQGLYIMVATHDMELAPAFTHTVDFWKFVGEDGMANARLKGIDQASLESKKDDDLNL